MLITYDPAKRAKTLAERGLDFEDAQEVLGGLTIEVDDDRRDYGERRVLLVGFTPRGSARHVYSMRMWNAREIRRYTSYLQQA